MKLTRYALILALAAAALHAAPRIQRIQFSIANPVPVARTENVVLPVAQPPEVRLQPAAAAPDKDDVVALAVAVEIVARRHRRPLETGRLFGPGARARIDGDLRIHQIVPIEQRDLARLGEQRVPQLLSITIDIRDAVGIDPATAIAARADVVEIADDTVAFILLQQLVGEQRMVKNR